MDGPKIRALFLGIVFELRVCTLTRVGTKVYLGSVHGGQAFPSLVCNDHLELGRTVNLKLPAEIKGLKAASGQVFGQLAPPCPLLDPCLNTLAQTSLH